MISVPVQKMIRLTTVVWLTPKFAIPGLVPRREVPMAEMPMAEMLQYPVSGVRYLLSLNLMMIKPSKDIKLEVTLIILFSASLPIIQFISKTFYSTYIIYPKSSHLPLCAEWLLYSKPSVSFV